MSKRAELSDTEVALAEIFTRLTEVARLSGLPAEWRVCDSCGEQSWVLPPHVGPCPLNVAAAEQFGMKLDAERMAAIRSGVSIDEMSKQFLDRLIPPDDREA